MPLHNRSYQLDPMQKKSTSSSTPLSFSNPISNLSFSSLLYARSPSYPSQHRHITTTSTIATPLLFIREYRLLQFTLSLTSNHPTSNVSNKFTCRRALSPAFLSNQMSLMHSNPFISWLNVEQRVQYKIISIRLLKIFINDKSNPYYLDNLIIIKETGRPKTRFSDHLSLPSIPHLQA